MTIDVELYCPNCHREGNETSHWVSAGLRTGTYYCRRCNKRLDVRNNGTPVLQVGDDTL